MGSCKVVFEGVKYSKTAMRQIMGTPEMVDAIDQEGIRIENTANAMAHSHGLGGVHKKAYSHKSGKNRAGFANTTIYTNSRVGKVDNYKHNTLLKAGGS